jgi:hypothetical protein
MNTTVSRESRSSYTFSVTSDGRNAKELILDLEQNGFRVSKCAKRVMSRPPLMVTNGVIYRVGIIFGEEFSDEERTTENIRKEAKRRCWLTPPAEIAPLARERITDDVLEELGLWWLMIMHERIKDSGDDPGFLALFRGAGGRWLGTFDGLPGYGWSRMFGFGFLVPQRSL